MFTEIFFDNLLRTVDRKYTKRVCLTINFKSSLGKTWSYSYTFFGAKLNWIEAYVKFSIYHCFWLTILTCILLTLNCPAKLKPVLRFYSEVANLNLHVGSLEMHLCTKSLLIKLTELISLEGYSLNIQNIQFKELPSNSKITLALIHCI